MQKILAIDCDEVLANTTEALFTYYNHQFNNKPITKEQVTSFFWHELPGYDADRLYTKTYFEDFFASPAVQDITPIDGSEGGIHQLHNFGYTLYVVTSRWKGTEDITAKRIETYYPGMFTDIIYGGSSVETHHLVNKADLMKHIGASLLIDDGLHNCLQVSQGGYHTLLLDNPWNQTERELPLITRVSDWHEIVDQLKNNDTSLLSKDT